MGPRRRALAWAIVIAVALGFAAGWFARVLSGSSPESRVREAAEGIRKRVRAFTH
jgi:hypothetical protein